MSDRILSIEEAAEETPWATSTLYRWAKEAGSPFRKVRGRWVVVYDDLVEAVRSGEKPMQRRSGVALDPMPRRRGGASSNVLAEVHELRRRAI